MAKETRLNDSADIYAKRDTQTEKQKISEMSRADKFQYFKDYYFKKLLAGGALLGLVIWFLVTVFSPKTETVLYAAIVNDYLDEDKTDAFTARLETLYEINPKKQNIILDASYQIDTKNTSTQTVASQQKLVTYISAAQIDVIIADADVFQTFARNDYFVDLADLLPTDVYSRLSDSLYISETESSTEQNAYGIYLTDCEKYKALGSVMKNPVIGIVSNSKYRDNAADFIKYLFKNE